MDAASADCFQNIAHQVEYRIWSLKIRSGMIHKHFLKMCMYRLRFPKVPQSSYMEVIQETLYIRSKVTSAILPIFF